MSMARDTLVEFRLEGTPERIPRRILNDGWGEGIILVSLVSADPRFPTGQAKCWFEGDGLVGRPQQPLETSAKDVPRGFILNKSRLNQTELA